MQTLHFDFNITQTQVHITTFITYKMSSSSKMVRSICNENGTQFHEQMCNPKMPMTVIDHSVSFISDSWLGSYGLGRRWQMTEGCTGFRETDMSTHTATSVRDRGTETTQNSVQHISSTFSLSGVATLRYILLHTDNTNNTSVLDVFHIQFTFSSTATQAQSSVG